MSNNILTSPSFDEIISSRLLSSCVIDRKFHGKIIIIGAGAAGLAAAYILHKKGIKCLILEASSRYGGRLKKLENFTDFPIDLGAEWLHERKSIVGDCVTKTGTKIYGDYSKVFYWFDNQMRSDLPNENVQMISKRKDLPDISIKDYARQQQWGHEYDAVLECLAGDIGGSADNVSAYWALEQYADPDNVHVDFRFEQTYFDFVKEIFLSPVAHLIQLNTQVTLIDYTDNEIILKDSSGRTFLAEKVILTVPITILKSNDIHFIPPLPIEKLDAFNYIGMEAGMKVFFSFSSKFYPSGVVTGCPFGCTYYDETYGKQSKDNVLQAFIVGKSAAYLTNLTDKQIIDTLLEELDTMYDKQARSTFVDAHVEDWTKEPFIRGAYSYPKVGINHRRKIAAENVNNKLFFAGEAMNTNLRTHTVHGAIETGVQAVIDIFNTL